jgi:hypothetical protein
VVGERVRHPSFGMGVVESVVEGKGSSRFAGGRRRWPAGGPDRRRRGALAACSPQRHSEEQWAVAQSTNAFASVLESAAVMHACSAVMFPAAAQRHEPEVFCTWSQVASALHAASWVAQFDAVQVWQDDDIALQPLEEPPVPPELEELVAIPPVPPELDVAVPPIPPLVELAFVVDWVLVLEELVVPPVPVLDPLEEPHARNATAPPAMRRKPTLTWSMSPSLRARPAAWELARMGS